MAAISLKNILLAKENRMEKQMKWKDQMLIQIRFVVVEHIRIVEFRENQQAINGHFFVSCGDQNSSRIFFFEVSV